MDTFAINNFLKESYKVNSYLVSHLFTLGANMKNTNCLDNVSLLKIKIDRVGPVDNRPSID